MTYRDDLDAAHHRADALQRHVDALQRRQRGALRPARPSALAGVVPPLLVAVMCVTFTGLALTLGWGTVWAGMGGLFALLAMLAMLGSSGHAMPSGTVPVRVTVAAPTPLSAVGIAAIAPDGDAATVAHAALDGHDLGEVAAIASALVELALRDVVAATPAPVGEALRERVTAAARERLAGSGLVLQALWVGPPDAALPAADAHALPPADVN